MNKATIAKWLGRPLTTSEDTNFDSYLNTAKSLMTQLLCTDILNNVTEERVFDVREGYTTVFTGYFEGNAAVSIDGTAVAPDKLSARFWDNRYGDFYNSIVFKDGLDAEEVTITASWGFQCPPNDLGKVYAQLFAVASKPFKSKGDVKSKRVEDFAVTFGDRTDTQMVVDANQTIINKYSLCGIGNIQSGAVCGFDSIRSI